MLRSVDYVEMEECVIVIKILLWIRDMFWLQLIVKLSKIFNISILK